MARLESLTKEEVISAIEAWRDGKLSDHEMHIWATNNYFPAHQKVAPGEPNQVALAIGVILTEFECSATPYAFQRTVADCFIELIQTPPDDLAQIKNKVYQII